MSTQSPSTPRDPNFNISSSPTGPVSAGTVIRFIATIVNQSSNPSLGGTTIRWEVNGPFSNQSSIVETTLVEVDSGFMSSFDWDTIGLRAGAFTVSAVRAGPPPTGEDGFIAGSPPVVDLFQAAVSNPATVGTAGTPLSPKGPSLLKSNEITMILTPATASANQDGILPVSLQRTAMVETPQQVLWVVIRNRTNAVGWRRYKEFIDGVMCSDPVSKVRTKGSIPFRGADAYQILKHATDLFLMHESGVIDRDFDVDTAFETGSPRGRLDPDTALDEIGAQTNNGLRDRAALEEQGRLGRPTSVDRLRTLRDAYYSQVQGETVLPYLRIIRDKLADIPLKGPDETPPNCYGILKSNLGGPIAMELIWSYWHEEGMLVQTLHAILARFQNRRHRPDNGPDPLLRFDLDPLRPLNNLFWGFAQDEVFRLTVRRRAFEYEHEYGLQLIGRAVPQQASVDRRSKFVEAYHNLLYLTHVFYKEDDDTTVIADAFPVLNALRETHLILAEGAHNQFGDLPSLARAEMMIMEWLLARPEVREFLGGRIMVPYEEEWMDRVDMVKSMEGWTDSTITHFRDLGVFGEQLVLSIRYGNWSTENNPQEAANWARYWRPEIQRYAHAYRSATGVDLTERVNATMPSTLLQRRLVSQRRS
jgi:hypothetical protein